MLSSPEVPQELGRGPNGVGVPFPRGWSQAPGRPSAWAPAPGEPFPLPSQAAASPSRNGHDFLCPSRKLRSARPFPAPGGPPPPGPSQLQPPRSHWAEERRRFSTIPASLRRRLPPSRPSSAGHRLASAPPPGPSTQPPRPAPRARPCPHGRQEGRRPGPQPGLRVRGPAQRGQECGWTAGAAQTPGARQPACPTGGRAGRWPQLSGA